MKNLREALEKYKRNKMSKATFEDDYMEGFQDCADLLFPLVEALEFYSKGAGVELIDEGRNYSVDYKAYENDYDADLHLDKPIGTKALQALADLKAKIGVE